MKMAAWMGKGQMSMLGRPIRVLLIAIFGWGCAGSGSLQKAERTWNPDAMDRFLAAKTFERHMNPHAAIVELLDALEEETSSASIYQALARNYWRVGKAERAVVYARRAVEVAPDLAENHQFLAMLLYRTGDLISTAAEWEAVLKMAPQDSETYLRLVNLYLQNRQEAEALWTLDRLSELEHLSPDIRMKLAGLYAVLGRMEVAKERYRGIVAQDPTFVEAWLHLGAMLRSEGNRWGAMTLYREGLRINPDSGEMFGELAELYVSEGMLDQVIDEEIAANPEFCYYMGLALMAKGYGAEAESVFERVISGPDSDPGLGVEIGRVYYAAGDYARAAQAFERSAREHPTDGDLLDFLGTALRQLGRWSEAIGAFQKAIALDPVNTNYLFDLASTLERSGAFDQAVTAFERLLEIDPEHPYALNYLGYMLADRGVRLDESLRLLEEAVAMEPSNGAFKDSLGWVYFRLGQTKKAEELLDQAIELLGEEHSEEDAVIFYHVGDVAYALGKMGKAKEYWRKSLEIDPNNPDVQTKLEQLERPAP